MSTPLTGQQTLDADFLTIRAKIIEVAAGLDRIDRSAAGDTTVYDDPRIAQIAKSLAVLATDHPNRAERIQLVFSLK
jgi:hypothetical protein